VTTGKGGRKHKPLGVNFNERWRGGNDTRTTPGSGGIKKDDRGGDRRPHTATGKINKKGRRPERQEGQKKETKRGVYTKPTAIRKQRIKEGNREK